MPHRAHAYSLVLADGTVWTFSTPPRSGLASWMDEFGRILRLQKDAGVGDGKGAAGTSPFGRGWIRIVPMTDKNQRPAGPDDSWTSYTQGSAYRAWISPDVTESVLEISPEFLDHREIRYIYMSAALRIVFRHCLAAGIGCSLHAATAALNGSGIIITASGQTGKSTCFNRFPPPWKPLADDIALAIRDSSGKFFIHPMPTWSDYLRAKKNSTFDTSAAYPLKGLFFLEQAKTDEVRPVTPAISAGILHRVSREAWSAFLSRLRFDQKKNLDHSLFNACCAIANATPGYILRATLHGKFWREIENVL